MKRRRFILVLSIAVMLSVMLSAMGCQATPKEDVVVNKGEGLPDGALAEEVSKPRQLKGAPEHWTESMAVGEEGKLTIQADAAVEIPELINIPVLELEPKDFTQEELDILVKYFASDSKLYVNQNITQTELEETKTQMQSDEGYYGDYWAKQNKINYLKNIDALLEQNLGDDPGKTYVTPSFGTQITQNDNLSGFIYSGEETSEYSKPCFKANIESGENAGATLHAYAYNKEQGSAGYFWFSSLQGQSGFGEEYLRDIKEMNQSSKESGGDTPYTQKMDSLLQLSETKIQQPAGAKEDAVTMAKDLLKDLHIDGMEVEKTGGYLFLPENSPAYTRTEDAMWYSAPEQWNCGYEITFSRGAEGIPSLIFYNRIITSSTPDTMYTPSFAPESITVRIGNGKVLDFEWRNMSQVTRTIATNTNLLDFETIKSRFSDHVYYSTVAEAMAHNDVNVAYQADVSRVRFGYSFITAYEEPEKVWMVPSWTFELVTKSTYGDGNYNSSMTEYNCFNALDGGYISLDNVALK